MIKTHSPSGSALLWLAALAVAYLSIRILVPVAGAITAAAIVASAVYPLHKAVRRFASQSKTGAAFATMAIVCLAIGGPLVAAAWFVTREAVHAYASIRELLASQDFGAWTPPKFFADLIGVGEIDVRRILIDNLDAIGVPATHAAGTVLRNFGGLIAGLIVFIAMLILFFRDGPMIVVAFERALPLSASRKSKLREKLMSAVDAAVQGVFLISLVQGAFAVLGFTLFRIPFAALLGALCAVLSPMPFIGSAFIWIPVVVRLALEGQSVRAVMLGAWFVFIVGLSDNVARPFLLRTKMKVPFSVIVVGVFGGIGAFGISGAFFGPIIAATALALLEAFDESRGSAESQHPDVE